MAVIVRMPEVATGTDEAAIASLLVAVGDEVGEGQALVEIETEKASVEIEAPDSGVVAGVLVGAGESATVGAPIVVLATGGQSAEEALAEVGIGSASASAPAGEPVTAAAPAAPAAQVASDVEAAPQASETASSDISQATDSAPETDRLFASPLVRKLVRERGIDLGAVQGSGPGGRIVRRDIDGIEEGSPAPQTVVPAATVAPSGSAPAASTGFSDTPHTGMRRAIARRLTESKSSVPHFYLVADCRVDELLALRAQVNELAETKISVNDFVLKAVAGAMQDIPEANVIWTDEATRRFDGVDIAVAVSVHSGLLTPVVRGAEKLSLSQLSLTVRDLAERARDGKLKQHELEGGSFSVSNLGMYGTTEFSAIINPPHSGILAIGAAEKRAVVNEDGGLGVATVMTVTLSVDHRALDGALAAQWLAAFKNRVERPMSILV